MHQYRGDQLMRILDISVFAIFDQASWARNAGREKISRGIGRQQVVSKMIYEGRKYATTLQLVEDIG